MSTPFREWTRGLLLRCCWGGVVVVAGAAQVDGAAPGAEKPAEVCYAWNSSDPYQAPDFEAYFPDDAKGAEALAVWWAQRDGNAAGNDDDLARVRQGLRRYPRSPVPLLRWVGNTFIWGKSPQHPAAIELMYHAATCNEINEDRYGTRGPAIYFGLAVVRPKTDAILRTLVDISMRVDDPNDLSRITWGVGKQREQAASFLVPYETDSDPAIREKAEAVRKILARELKAVTWATAKRREAAQASWGDQLASLTAALHTGNSKTRREVLELIAREHIALIMDDSHVSAFAQCSADADPEVRAQTARMVGERWIGAVREPTAEAIDLALYLAEDEEPAVRQAAVYYGLSAMVDKDDRVLRRLVELALEDQESEGYRRILWSLRRHRVRVMELLPDYQTQPSKASRVATFSRDFSAAKD